jgi:hypothetical protein
MYTPSSISKALTGQDTLCPRRPCSECLVADVKKATYTEGVPLDLPQEEKSLGNLPKKAGCPSASRGQKTEVTSLPGSPTSTTSFLLTTPSGECAPRNVEIKRKPVALQTSGLPQSLQIGKKLAPATTFDDILSQIYPHKVAIPEPVKVKIQETFSLGTAGKSKGGDRATLPSQLQVSSWQGEILRGGVSKTLQLRSTAPRNVGRTPTVLRIGQPNVVATPMSGGEVALPSPKSTYIADSPDPTTVKALSTSQPNFPVVKIDKPWTPTQFLPCPNSAIQTLKHYLPSILQSGKRPEPKYIAYTSPASASRYKAYASPNQRYKPYRAPTTFDEILGSLYPYQDQIPTHPQFIMIVTPSANEQVYPVLNHIKPSLLYPVQNRYLTRRREASKMYALEEFEEFADLRSMIIPSPASPALLLPSGLQADASILEQEQMNVEFEWVGYYEDVATFVSAEVNTSDMWEEINLSGPASANVSVQEYVATSFEGMGVPFSAEEDEFNE